MQRPVVWAHGVLDACESVGPSDHHLHRMSCSGLVSIFFAFQHAAYLTFDMPKRSSKPARDLNALVKFIADQTTGNAPLVFHCINNFGWYPPLPHGRGSEKRRPIPETLSAMEH